MTKAPISFATAATNPNIPFVEDIDADELLKKKNDVYIVDVRRPDEYTGELGHIAGSKLIVLDTIPDKIDEIPRDQTVVFVCRSGGRSAQATAFAKQSGFENVYNMKGGMLRWNELGLPIESNRES